METLRLKSHGIYMHIYIYIYICKSSRTEAFDIALLSDYVIVFVRSPPPYGRRVGKSVTVKKILSRFQDWPDSRLEKRGEARRGETKKKDKKERCPVDNHHGYCSQRILENGSIQKFISDITRDIISTIDLF